MNYKTVLEEQIKELQKVQEKLSERLHEDNVNHGTLQQFLEVSREIRSLISAVKDTTRCD